MNTKLKHDQDAGLRFTEATCDFGSLIIELGPERAWKLLSEAYPQQAAMLRQVANQPPVARLLQP